MPRLFILFCCTLALAMRAEEPKTDAPKPHVEGYKDTPMIPGTQWHVHDPDRPQPRVVTPGTASTPEKPGKAPSDAVVLFDGTDIEKWEGGDHKPSKWKIENGEMISVKGAGYIFTKDKFTDFQLHVEWAAPTPAQGNGQGRGNSGVFLQGVYEIQIVDSFNNPTYADGTAAAVYGQHPPLVNCALPPGEWQTYDIVFTSAKFEEGKLKTPAFVTVMRNGIIVQNHADIMGPTGHRAKPEYKGVIEKGPIGLQDHGNPVRFRNIWIRELKADDMN